MAVEEKQASYSNYEKHLQDASVQFRVLKLNFVSLDVCQSVIYAYQKLNQCIISLPWLSTTSIPTLGYDNFKDELVWVNLIPLKISEKLIFRIICFPTTSQLFLTTMILKTKSLKKICASKTPGSSLMVALALTGSCWVFQILTIHPTNPTPPPLFPTRPPEFRPWLSLPSM